MFITDGSGTSHPARILRYDLLGGQRRVLVDTKIRRPSGIAVDPITKTVYWTDSQRDVIEGMDYNGRKR